MTKYQNKQETRRERKLAVKKWMVSTSFRVSLLVMIGIFGLLYIIQMSSVSTKGFTISELQQDIQSLENETRALSVQIAEHRSMASIQDRLSGMNLVAAGNIEYVTPVGTEVARR
ncbi:hypothetical protein KJ641_02540 [Patescibacteria group bacterium]|nr:hypothetical protein [Patescibacteria group bacterium]MBU1895723.1 hypothetical protein [Patescibacteria group bacterium]